jgi:ubiquitin-like-conjugating enzyme ATG3
MEESAECALDDDTTISSLQCRRYNCMVSYDKYYRVPRMWLNGWDQTGSPLSDRQMLEDVMHEYALRTVTIEAFPLADKCQARSLSIHPCNHAQAFINIIKSLQECGKTPKVEHILFIYLKFMASVVPTIDYDWSFDVEIKGTAA